MGKKVIAFFTQNLWTNYVAAFFCGSLLAAATFSSSSFFQLLSISSVIFILTIMLSGKAKDSKNCFLLGAVFFGSWLLPTTYWYYGFMNPLVAFAASFGFVLLLSNIFYLFTLRGKLPDYLLLLIFSFTWALFTFLRMRLPVTEDWWIPHLGYTFWRNTAILNVGKYGGEATIELFILLFSSLCAFIVKKGKPVITAFLFICFTAGIFFINGSFAHIDNNNLPVIIAIQSSTFEQNTDATMQVIQKITRQTEDALDALDNSKGKDVYVVWPENRIPPELIPELSEFAQNKNINLIFHSFEPSEVTDSPYKVIIWMNNSGDIALINSKKHIAPGENGTPRSSNKINEGKTAYICYDVHYPDIVPRMKQAEIVFVALNDEEFGSLQKTFHLADMALRAVQADVFIAAASKDGPTAIINPNGYVEHILIYLQDGIIIYA